MADGIKWYSGVRDDPFIFPQFFGTNVIAMVIRIPLDYFPGGRQDFMFWATSQHRGKQIDHVGRSQRTQLPRFDFLNTVHPKDHVPAIIEQRDNPGLKDDFLRSVSLTEFNLRPYDLQPDVMYYTRRSGFEAKYPNGRQLEDDVANLTCLQGDCQLFELSQSHRRSATFPGGRPTRNDKEFSDTFPYLADPGLILTPQAAGIDREEQDALVAHRSSAALLVFLFPWVLYFWTLRRSKASDRQLTALRRPQPAPALIRNAEPSSARTLTTSVVQPMTTLSTWSVK